MAISAKESAPEVRNYLKSMLEHSKKQYESKQKLTENEKEKNENI